MSKKKEIISPFRKVVSKIARKQREIEIAINMLKEGSKVDFISKVTNLTIKEVEELKNNLK